LPLLDAAVVTQLTPDVFVLPQVSYLLQGNNLNPFNGSKVTTFADALRNALVRLATWNPALPS